MNSVMNIDKNLLSLLRKMRGSFLIIIISVLLTAFMIILQAKSLSLIINDVFLKSKTLGGVESLLILFILASLLRAVFQQSERYVAGEIAGQIRNKLREEITDKIKRFGPVLIRSEKSGELSNMLSKGVDSLESYLSHYLPQLLHSALIPMIILLIVFPLDLLSGLVLMLTAPLIPLFMVLIGSIADRRSKRQWAKLSRMSAFFLDAIEGLTTLKILGVSKEYAARIRRISDEFSRITISVLKVAFLSALVLELVATISTAIIAVEIGIRLLYAKIDFADALFILILAPEFYQTLRQLGTRFHAGLQGVSAAQRIFSFLATPLHPAQKSVKKMVDIKKATIEFDNVTYCYPSKHEPALSEINFTLQAGSRNALIGPKGSGKSTISYLLMRFITAQRGSILVNGCSLEQLDVKSWQKACSWVSQQPYLFHCSVLENIRLAKPEATMKQVIAAAEKASLHQFINELSEGYDTLVGEKGVRFSGGEGQRIALARAFLKDAPLVILDEPTANLDPELQRTIQQSLDLYMEGKTLLVIAHHLQTVKNADQVVLLAEGKINAVGNHADLLNKSDLYKELVKRGVSTN